MLQGLRKTKRKMYTSRTEDLKLWLIRAMLASAGAGSTTNFSGNDWVEIDRIAAQHRLRPMLHNLLRMAGCDWQPPLEICKSWKHSYDKTFFRNLQCQAKLVEVTSLLNATSIDFAALKGAALWPLYGDPALRPVRDIDLLVSPDQAAAAQSALLASGCVLADSEANLTDYAQHKHLAALFCPRRNVVIEIHTALADRKLQDDADDILFQVDRLLARKRYQRIGDVDVPMLAWPETLLHLIVHSVYDHQMNNGPLILADCLALFEADIVDTEKFWQLAQAAGRQKGVHLILETITQFSGQQFAGGFAQLDNAVISPELCVQSALLMLQDMEQADAQGGWSRLHTRPSILSQIKLLATRAQRRAKMAAEQGGGDHVDSGNAALAKRMVLVWLHPEHRREIGRSKAVYRWLGK